jgi:hypothetical protein
MKIVFYNYADYDIIGKFRLYFINHFPSFKIITISKKGVDRWDDSPFSFIEIEWQKPLFFNILVVFINHVFKIKDS